MMKTQTNHRHLHLPISSNWYLKKKYIFAWVYIVRCFYFQFRFANGFEMFLMAIGVVSSIGTGICQPLNVLLMGDLTGAMVDQALNGSEFINMTDPNNPP